MAQQFAQCVDTTPKRAAARVGILKLCAPPVLVCRAEVPPRLRSRNTVFEEAWIWDSVRLVGHSEVIPKRRSGKPVGLGTRSRLASWHASRWPRPAAPASPIVARRHCRPPGRASRDASVGVPPAARWAAARRPRPRASARAAAAARCAGAPASRWTAPRSPAAAGGPIPTCARRARMRHAGAGARDESLPGATAGRQPEPVAVSGRLSVRGGGRPTVRPRAASPNRRPDVRQAARMTMPARGRVTNRCPAPLPAARPNQSLPFPPGLLHHFVFLLGRFRGFRRAPPVFVLATPQARH